MLGFISAKLFCFVLKTAFTLLNSNTRVSKHVIQFCHFCCCLWKHYATAQILSEKWLTFEKLIYFIKNQFSTKLETLMATPTLTASYVQIFCCSYQMPMQAECSEEETFTSYKCVPLLQRYNSHFLLRLFLKVRRHYLYTTPTI